MRRGCHGRGPPSHDNDGRQVHGHRHHGNGHHRGRWGHGEGRSPEAALFPPPPHLDHDYHHHNHHPHGHHGRGHHRGRWGHSEGAPEAAEGGFPPPHDHHDHQHHHHHHHHHGRGHCHWRGGCEHLWSEGATASPPAELPVAEAVPVVPVAVAVAVALPVPEDESQTIKLEVIKRRILAGEDRNELDPNGFTALMRVCRAGCEDVVDYLLAINADVNLVSPHEQTTALHLACLNNHMSIAEKLIRHGAKVCHVDVHGKKAFDYVADGADRGTLEVVSGAMEVILK